MHHAVAVGVPKMMGHFQKSGFQVGANHSDAESFLFHIVRIVKQTNLLQ